MVRDRRHEVMSLKRLNDGAWQLWCGCGSIFTEDTVAKVTNSHADHVIHAHHLEIYGEDKP